MQLEMIGHISALAIVNCRHVFASLMSRFYPCRHKYYNVNTKEGPIPLMPFFKNVRGEGNIFTHAEEAWRTP
jgi:hypothetical protein